MEQWPIGYLVKTGYMLDLENGGYGIGFGDAGLVDMKVVPFPLPCD